MIEQRVRNHLIFGRKLLRGLDGLHTVSGLDAIFPSLTLVSSGAMSANP